MRVFWAVIAVLDRGLGAVWLVYAVTGIVPVIVFRARIHRDRHLGAQDGLTALVPAPHAAEVEAAD